MGRALATLYWFLKLSLSSVWVLIPLLLLCVALVVVHQRAEPIQYRKYWLLAVLPAIWMFVGLWAGMFWVEWQKFPVVPNPRWVISVIWASAAAFLLSGIGTILIFREARLFATIYFAINLYFMAAMYFLARMALTGDWL
jgi:hypothetical protein